MSCFWTDFVGCSEACGGYLLALGNGIIWSYDGTEAYYQIGAPNDDGFSIERMDFYSSHSGGANIVTTAAPPAWFPADFVGKYPAHQLYTANPIDHVLSKSGMSLRPTLQTININQAGSEVAYTAYLISLSALLAALGDDGTVSAEYAAGYTSALVFTHFIGDDGMDYYAQTTGKASGPS